MDIANNIKTKTRRFHICQRCGGQVFRSHDEIVCLQCGAPHTEEGELVMTLTIEEYEAMLALQKGTGKTKNSRAYSILDED